MKHAPGCRLFMSDIQSADPCTTRKSLRVNVCVLRGREGDKTLVDHRGDLAFNPRLWLQAPSNTATTAHKREPDKGSCPCYEHHKEEMWLDHASRLIVMADNFMSIGKSTWPGPVVSLNEQNHV